MAQWSCYVLCCCCCHCCHCCSLMYIPYSGPNHLIQATTSKTTTTTMAPLKWTFLCLSFSFFSSFLLFRERTRLRARASLSCVCWISEPFLLVAANKFIVYSGRAGTSTWTALGGLHGQPLDERVPEWGSQLFVWPAHNALPSPSTSPSSHEVKW